MGITPWTTALYDELTADLLLAGRRPEDVAQTVAFLTRVLDLSPGDRVFDQCCGVGTIATALADAGLRVVGVDQAASYVAEATTRDPRLELYVGDAACFVPGAPCRGAFSWWTSLGHGDDASTRAMLRCLFASLEPGGRAAVDFLHMPGIMRHFEAVTTTERETRQGRVALRRESAIDLATGHMRKRWTYSLPDGRQSVRETSLRAYFPHELVERLVDAGFEPDVSLYGDVDGRPLELDSPRCLVVARRPGGRGLGHG